MISLLNKKKFFLVFIIQTIFSFSVYGVSYAFQYYLKAPLTVKKLTSLITVIGVLYVINMISQWGYIYFAEVIFTENQYNSKYLYCKKIWDNQFL